MCAVYLEERRIALKPGGRMNPPPKLTINPNRIRTRDVTLLALINGATKAAVHFDRKKLASRRACRGRVRVEEIM
jgi:hypothetical protein